MIFGHFAVAAIAKQTCFQRRNATFLIMAALLPDLVDKPTSVLLDLPRRGLGHSVVVLVSVTLMAWLLSPRLRSETGILSAGVIMWMTHLLGDLVELKVLLWPLLGPLVGSLDAQPPFHFWEKMYQFYVVRLWPEQFWLDVCCVTVAAAIFVARAFISGRRLTSVVPFSDGGMTVSSQRWCSWTSK
jgi:hypothetical protein